MVSRVELENGYFVKRLRDNKFYISNTAKTPIWFSTEREAQRHVDRVGGSDTAEIVRLPLKRNSYAYNGYEPDMDRRAARRAQGPSNSEVFI